MLASALLAGSSCQNESSEAEVAESVETVFAVQIPSEPMTKYVSKAEKTDVVYYEVWDADFQKRLFPYPGSMENNAPVSGCAAEISIDLVKGQKYNLIFWAQNAGCGAYSWTDLKKVNVDYSKFKDDQKDVYDAFYAVMENVEGDGKPKTVRLYRPFSQVNFCAAELKTTLGPITLSGNTVTVSEVATTFVTRTGLGENPAKNVTFGTAADFVEDKTIEVDSKTYHWVAMNYLLVPSSSVDKPSVNVTVTADFATDFGTVTHNVPNVPIQRNYRTNIVGDIFTAGAKLNIIVDPGFVKPDKPTIEINNN